MIFSLYQYNKQVFIADLKEDVMLMFKNTHGVDGERFTTVGTEFKFWEVINIMITCSAKEYFISNYGFVPKLSPLITFDMNINANPKCLETIKDILLKETPELLI